MALTKISGSILKDPLNLGEVSIGGTLTYEDVTNVDSIGIVTARSGINVSGGQLDVGSNLKLGNAGVITATSLRVGGIDSDIANSSADDAIFGRTDSGDTGITIFTGGGSTGRIFFGDGHGSAADRAGTINYSHVHDFMSFGTNGNNERLRIDSTGRLLLNTTTEGNAGADDFTIGQISGSTGITIRSGTTNNGNLYFSDGTSGDDEYRGSIQYQHANNSLHIATNAVEKLRIDSSGNVDIATGQLTISNDIKSSDDDFYVYSYKGGSDGQVRSGIQYDGNSQRLRFFTGTNERLRIDQTGKVRFAKTDMQIELQTSDGSDNGFLNLSGGGACSQGRGAQVVMYGNEHSGQEGRLLLLAGQSAHTNGTIDFFTSGSKKATINNSGCLHIGDVGYGSDNYRLDVEGGIACEGSGNGTGRYGTIYSNFGGDSGNRQCGSYTIHCGQMSMHGSGNRYMHIKFDMPAGAMWYMKIEGYEYIGGWTSTVNGASINNDKVHYSLSGGYIYAGQAMFNGKAKAHRGITPVWYLHGNDLCVYIDTVNTGTGNRWGFYRFSGGHDGIVGRSNAKPIAIVAYSFSSSTSNPF